MERAGPPSLSPPLGSPPFFFFLVPFFETCTLMFRVSAQRATDSRVRIRVAVPASACVAGQLEKTQSSHGSSASRWFGSSTWDDDDDGGDKHCHVSFEIPAQSLMTWTIVEFPNICRFEFSSLRRAPDRYVRQLRGETWWWWCLQVVFLPRVRERRALHFSFLFPAPLHVVIRSACAVSVCVGP